MSSSNKIEDQCSEPCHPNDVICSRGKGSHAGNKRYYEAIKDSAQVFFEADRIEKDRIVTSIINRVHESGGIFRERVRNKLVEIPLKRCKEKVRKALNDKITKMKPSTDQSLTISECIINDFNYIAESQTNEEKHFVSNQQASIVSFKPSSILLGIPTNRSLLDEELDDLEMIKTYNLKDSSHNLSINNPFEKRAAETCKSKDIGLDYPKPLKLSAETSSTTVPIDILRQESINTFDCSKENMDFDDCDRIFTSNLTTSASGPVWRNFHSDQSLHESFFQLHNEYFDIELPIPQEEERNMRSMSWSTSLGSNQSEQLIMEA